ncbi:small acid-soluble spore protein Tlp [Bacillus rugosus]
MTKNQNQNQNQYQQPNPDDRSDNVEKLQDMVQNTIENIEEAEASMEFASGEDKQRIKEKNERREQSIEAFRNEIQDESAARQNGYRS